MQRYTERLAVLVTTKTMKAIKKRAISEKMPVSEWLRRLVEKEINS